MDPVTAAIVAALGIVAGGAGQAVGGSLATDAYEKLKATLKRKFGDDSDVVRSVESLEAKPDSSGRKQTLEEDVQDSGADQDPDVREAAQEFLDLLKTQPGGEQHIQNAVGSYIAQADRGGKATVDVDFPGEQPEE